MTAISQPLDVFLQFANGLAVALVLAFVAIVFRNKLQIASATLAMTFDGAVFGAIGIAVMFFPFPIAPGAALDVRVVPVVLAGPFGGPGAALIAGAIVAGYRLYLGGAGIIAGTGAIVTVACIGAIIGRRWEEKAQRIGVRHLLMLGLSLVAATLGWTLLLPADLVPIALKTFTLPVLISHPIGVVVLGLLLMHEAGRRHAETALQQSEARLRAIIDNSPAGIYLKDTQGRYILANDEFLRRFALAEDSIIGKKADSFMSPKIAERVAIQDREVIENSKNVTMEFEATYPDGTVRRQIMVKFPVLDADGAITGIGGINADITDWKRAEENARRSEALFREFFESAELVFVTLDTGGRVIACNDFLLRLTGHKRADVMGAVWWDMFIPADERAVLRQLFEHTVVEGRIPMPPHFENDILAKGDEHRTIAWDNVLTCGPEGEIKGVVCVGVDITERRRAIAAIRMEKERAEQYLSIAGTIIVALDATGAVTLINGKGCEVLEFGPTELAGRNWFDALLPAESRERSRAVYLGVVEGRHAPVEYFENEVVTKSGRRRLIAWHASYARGETGAVTGTLSAGIDVTEQRRAEKEAADLRDRLARVARLSTMGEMATGFAHELNQPLAAINNYARGALRVLKKSPAPDMESLVMALEKLSEQAERAGNVIRRIRWFVQKNAPQATAIDLNQTICEATELFNDDTLRHQVLLELDLGPALPPVLADGIQIQQVVINLARNAMEAMESCAPDGRKLAIRTAVRPGSRVEVTVADTGPGLPPEIRDDLFEPFVTTKPDGMGIGLSICRSIVAAHGGNLTAESADGVGTTFRFTLPLADHPATAAA
ncbi:PAS domain S-box protein [Shumkonia mesophila]|uniref:PAS domain S-box protein n=1 Tax=Shumkonia mesophila TaxID=2838854 RepID=UPI0029343197|nr:PAS domain S-box protein [Shumkonia mesophila]